MGTLHIEFFRRKTSCVFDIIEERKKKFLTKKRFLIKKEVLRSNRD